MLTISPTASEAIAMLAQGTAAPDAAGVRIAAGEPTAEGTPLALSLVEGPQPQDEIIVGEQGTVFVEPQVAPYLEDSVLDAQVNDGEVAFALRDGAPQAQASQDGAGPR